MAPAPGAIHKHTSHNSGHDWVWPNISHSSSEDSNSKILTMYAGERKYIPWVWIQLLYNPGLFWVFLHWKTDKLLYQTTAMKLILFPFVTGLPGSLELNSRFKHRRHLAVDGCCTLFFLSILSSAHYSSSTSCSFSFIISSLSYKLQIKEKSDGLKVLIPKSLCIY